MRFFVIYFSTHPMSTSQSIPNIQALVQACNELHISYSFYDSNHNFVGLNVKKPSYFANASTPLNDESVSKICKDKEFTFKLVGTIVRMPKTLGFVNPLCDPQYQKYVQYDSYAAIASKIEKEFTYPLIIKMNSGSRGANIYKCHNKQDVLKALAIIYNKQSFQYDYIALAQEYISIAREFRVIIFNKKVVLVYEKDFSKAQFVGNISPFHQENARALHITDSVLVTKLQNFIDPLFSRLDVMFAGLDIVLDKDGDCCMIELNSKPGFEYFVRDNGYSALVDVYKKIISYLK
ncbi:MAG: alpha-L-glutamate ligase [Patescibacteria group bacterium]